MAPSRNSSASGGTSSRSLTTAANSSRSRAAASRTALPETKVWREAVVGPPSGVRSRIRRDDPHPFGEHAQFLGDDGGQDRRQPLPHLRRARPAPRPRRRRSVPPRRWRSRRRRRPGRCSCRPARRPQPSAFSPSRHPQRMGSPGPSPCSRRISASTRSRHSSRPTLSRSRCPVQVTAPTRRRFPPPDRDGVHPQFVGQFVQSALHGEGDLGDAEAAKRPGRRVVGVVEVAVNADVGDFRTAPRRG
jgi:hypothetical protein